MYSGHHLSPFSWRIHDDEYKLIDALDLDPDSVGPQFLTQKCFGLCDKQFNPV
jgi:hypothetical protein